MDTGSAGQSNTLNLIAFIESMRGDTFTEKCRNTVRVLDARMSRVGQGSDTWLQLLKTKGLVEAFIRLDGDVPFAKEANVSVIRVAA